MSELSELSELSEEKKCELCCEVVPVAKQDKKNHSCSLCDYTTARKDNLKRHMRSVHPDPQVEPQVEPELPVEEPLPPIRALPEDDKSQICLIQEEPSELQLVKDELQELKEMYCALLVDFQVLSQQVEELKQPKEKPKKERVSKKKAVVVPVPEPEVPVSEYPFA